MRHEVYEERMREQTAAYVAAVLEAHPELREPEPEPTPVPPMPGVEQRVPERKPVTLHDLLRDVEKGMLPPPRGIAKLIIKTVADRHSVSVRSIVGRCRLKEISAIRQEAMWEVYIRTELSLPQIGALFDRDHTTVLHGVRRHEERLKNGGRRT